MNKYLVLIGLLVMSVMVGCKSGSGSENFLKAQQFSEKMSATKAFNLVDVRTPEEFEKGHIENAKNIDWNGNSFESEIAGLDKSLPVFLYCLTDARSSAAAEALKSKGYEVFVLEGGMMKWRGAELAVVSEVAAPEPGLTLEGFNELINSDKVVLIDFYAEWCGPCKKMEPFLNEISTGMQKEVVLVRIDTDKNPVLTQQLGIQALPFLQIYKNQKKVWENLGFINKEGVVSELEKHL